MGWFFGRKRDIEKLKAEVQDSFGHVKKDFNKVGQWIKHLDEKETSHEDEMGKIKKSIEAIKSDLEEIKDFISFFGPQLSKQVSKHQQTGVIQQTGADVVQTPVQTAVQTGILDQLTVMERAIVWALLNSDLKLSYEDLAAVLGKEKSTIRGQINAIKQKSESLIQEISEPNGKKRLFIPEKMRVILLKNVKVSARQKKRSKKNKDIEEI